MEGNCTQEQDQDPDRIPSQPQLRGRDLLAGPKPLQHLLFAEKQHGHLQQQQHPPPLPAAPTAVDQASLSLFFPTTHQPHSQTTNDAAGTTTTAYITARAHNPTIPTTATDQIAPAAVASVDQLDPQPAAAPARSRWMGEVFSMGQWQELELQALIYKYMLAGASIPIDLILPIKRSLLTTPALDLDQHHPFHHASPLLQAGHWGRCLLDPEPGRCRRTDGKKWRCSREVMAGRKYCERHALRGRNRSRKPVETPAAAAPHAPPGSRAGGGGSILPSTENMMPVLKGSDLPSVLSPSATGMDSHGQRPPPDHGAAAGRYFQENYQCHAFSHEGLSDDNSGRGGSRVLRHFFDDWPRASQQAPHIASLDGTVSGLRHPASGLSISAPENQPSSDFFLKLCTGSSDKYGPLNDPTDNNRVRFVGEEQLGLLPPPPAWSGLRRQLGASMGGPLAEVLGSASGALPSAMSIMRRPV